MPVVKNLTSNRALVLAGLVAGAYMVNRALNVHKKASDALAPVSNAIGSTWASVSMALNGSHKVQATQGGFYLDDKYINEDFKIAPFWVESISNTHVDNPAIFAKLLDAQGRIKPAYRVLIGTVITKEELGL